MIQEWVQGTIIKALDEGRQVNVMVQRDGEWSFYGVQGLLPMLPWLLEVIQRHPGDRMSMPEVTQLLEVGKVQILLIDGARWNIG